MFSQTLAGLLIVFLPGIALMAQETEVDYLHENSLVVEFGRYRGVQGTAYRYATFRPGVLYDAALNEYPVDSLNFNGFTSRFECVIDGELRELAGHHFLRARVRDDDGVEHTYGWAINPSLPDKYAELLFHGDFLTASMFYEVTNDYKGESSMGKPGRLARFVSRSHYYAMVDGELVSLSMSPRRLAGDLGLREELTAYIKEHKLKTANRDDLLRILARAEALLAGER
ncbi:hypothetical protein GGR28_002541 [Lewinella aquimaris]|uniref:Uncharacterized protein n=1 Tax=Neolewinella aquimaris TaxID=1835722 RepID=A0A840E2V5_9BACT|nr:hypothetical protein [Neolewinella aquimaris]MBB4079914.1 hypothetical protein [Neolewinella aquimaris]